MKRILITFGTRPEAIKMAPVIDALNALKRNGSRIDIRVCNTGQHGQMLDQVLDFYNIRPHDDLRVMQSGQDLADLTGRILTGMRGILRAYLPDVVVVHGDTTTTFASALAAFYEKCSVAHVEAGLRTGNMSSPWPEEMNRCLTSRIAKFHFAPTSEARRNLLTEGVSPEAIFVTGNTVIDSLLATTHRLNSDPDLKTRLDDQFYFLTKTKRLILVTGHRRENFGDGFKNICIALSEIAQRPDIEIVYPVHLNPNVQNPVRNILGNHTSVHLLDPLDYVSFVYLMQRATLILTDSGGIQEEAPTLGKPVLLMRDTTERPEGLSAGTTRLVGTRSSQIVEETISLLEDPEKYQSMSHATNPYGDGKAADRIARVLAE